MRDMSPQDSNPERLGGGAGEQPPARRRGFDYLIVGAGFAGSVLAERLAAGLNKRVLVVDRRPHIAGNAYDYHDESGVLIHRYGPHIFHTNAQRIVDYLSQFTEWRPYEHRVLAQVDGQQVPIPFTELNESWSNATHVARSQQSRPHSLMS